MSQAQNEPESVFRLYRRAQRFLSLNSDEAIDPDMWGEGELSDAERLIVDLAFALHAFTSWRPITPEDVGRKMLVSNSADITDNTGQCSHVWVGRIQETKDEARGPYIVFDEADRLIWNVRWCREIPQAVSSADDDELRDTIKAGFQKASP